MPKHETLAAALAAFQAELPKLRKTETAKVTGESKSGAKISYSYGYTGLDQVVETALPVAGAHGLSITSKTTYADSLFMLEVVLLHEGGEREIGYWPLPDPRRVGPQDIGSAMTYGRRYETLGLLGLYPGGEDDDGAKAQQTSRERWEDAKAVQRPVEDRQAQSGQEPQAAPTGPPVKTSWTDAEVHDIQAKMVTAALDKTIGAYDWMAGKGLHNRKVVGSGEATEIPRSATDIMASRLADEALKADNSPAIIDGLKAIAADRGLLKVQVSETETLDQAIFEARELAAHAAAEASPGSAGPS